MVQEACESLLLWTHLYDELQTSGPGCVNCFLLCTLELLDNASHRLAQLLNLRCVFPSTRLHPFFTLGILFLEQTSDIIVATMSV